MTAPPIPSVKPSWISRGYRAGLAALAAVVLAGCATTDDGSRAAAMLNGHDDDVTRLLSRLETPAPRSHARATGYSYDYQPSVSANVATDDDPLADNPFIAFALEQIGIRYRYGGNSPDTGFDCSGLVAFAARQALGLHLPRRSAEQASTGISVKRSELQPGDLVFFNTAGRRYSHVGIYLGDDQFVHAPSKGGAVRIETMTVRYWNSRYNGARRITNGITLAQNSN